MIIDLPSFDIQNFVVDSDRHVIEKKTSRN